MILTIRLYGSGVPNLEKVKKVRVVLSQGSDVFRWETPNVYLSVQNGAISLRLPREQTMAFHPGQVMVQVRWVTEEGIVGESLVRALRVYRAFDTEAL